ncbi:hypothetical protein PI124_g24053 [Phytophthora idaei]|nr:hypothetical protein PI124_g24053 [Phytophthora idaei]
MELRRLFGVGNHLRLEHFTLTLDLLLDREVGFLNGLDELSKLLGGLCAGVERRLGIHASAEMRRVRVLGTLELRLQLFNFSRRLTSEQLGVLTKTSLREQLNLQRLVACVRRVQARPELPNAA